MKFEIASDRGGIFNTKSNQASEISLKLYFIQEMVT
jgi:hypothetical protein